MSQPKLMTAHYPGRCKKCGKRFPAGASIYWSKATGAFHANCNESEGGSQNGNSESKQTPKKETKLSKGSGSKPKDTSTRKGNEAYFTIDWSELRGFMKQAMDGDFSFLNRKHNRAMAASHTTEVTSWHGFTANQLREWLRDGYKADAIRVGDMTPPLREKRRYVYAEDGEEIYIDRALSGEDNFMGEWTKRERIPGVAVEAEIMFCSGVKAPIVNAYNAWICKAVYALESAGIDCQVTLKYSSGSAVESGEMAHTIVRVKQENESSDFWSFSPMMSPASLRSFGFVAMTIHADTRGRDIASGYGRGTTYTKWTCDWDNERRVMLIGCPYMPNDFPEEEMNEKFREALKQMKTS